MIPEKLSDTVVTALDEMKAIDIRAIDVREQTTVTDFMIVASGSSNRHVKSLANEVVRQAKALGIKPLGVEGDDVGEWVLVDLGDSVVHVMLPQVRLFYQLEDLWTAKPSAHDSVAGDDNAAVDTDADSENSDQG